MVVILIKLPITSEANKATGEGRKHEQILQTNLNIQFVKMV